MCWKAAIPDRSHVLVRYAAPGVTLEVKLQTHDEMKPVRWAARDEGGGGRDELIKGRKRIGESTLKGDDPMATYYTIEEGHYSMGNTSTNICSYSQVQHIHGLEHDFVALRVCELWIKVQIRGTPVDGRVARRRVILRVQR